MNGSADSLPRSSGPARWRVWVRVTLLVALVALALGLGWHGYLTLYAWQEADASILDSLYGALQLFVLETNLDPGSKPWTLEAARFLAPFATVYAAALALLALLGGRLQRLRMRDHVVVCGAGDKGTYLALAHLERNDRVVVIERDAQNDAIATCRRRGAMVLEGDATDPFVLRAAKVSRARTLFAVCGEDATDLEIAFQVRQLVKRRRKGREPIDVFAHIIDLFAFAALEESGFPTSSKGAVVTRFFNFHENCARSQLASHPLDRVHIGPHDNIRIHLIVIGSGADAEALVLQTARTAHFANLNPTRVTLLDPEADHNLATLRARHPSIDRILSLDAVTAAAEEARAREALAEWTQDPAHTMTVAVVPEDPTRAVSLALALPAEVRQAEVPVWVNVRQERGIARMLIEHGGWLRPYGLMRQGCSTALFQRDDLEVVPRMIHEIYLAQALAQGRSMGENPALVPWSQLAEGLKASNRQQADHIPVKLRAAGCRAVPRPTEPLTEPFDFTPEEVEVLAMMEHQRWCAERWLAGWRLGPSDKARKFSPYLVPWTDLEDDIREYDRDAVQSIPAVLEKVGKIIVRCQPDGPVSTEAGS